MITCERVRPTHLERQAVVYVRQSSPHQVHHHHESRALQYALRSRAVELGWPASRVRVVDCDLGHSAKSIQGRAGFAQLVADVALGKVGIILAYDATRLARNCTDWYALLDTCGHRDCLLGDHQGVYDPATIDGRLLLGLKGQISEMELHTLRDRLGAGLLNKARRGELALCLPVGLMRDAGGQVLKHPNREVQERLSLVFELFETRKSAARVVRALKEQELDLPRRSQFGDVIWRAPNQAGVCAILKNPAYAGAFVYGRTRCCAAAGGAGGARLRKRLSRAGFRSPTSTTVLPGTVRELRLRHNLLLRPAHSRPRTVNGYLTVTALAKKLDIHRHWIYDRIHSGVIEVHKDKQSRTYLIPDNQKTLKQFRQLLSGKLQSLRI